MRITIGLQRNFKFVNYNNLFFLIWNIPCFFSSLSLFIFLVIKAWGPNLALSFLFFSVDLPISSPFHRASSFAMKGTAATSILVILVVSTSLKCSAANKTKLLISSLTKTSKDNTTTIGIDLAIEVAKNSSDLKDFLGRYEIRMGSFATEVCFVVKNVYLYNIIRYTN